MSQKNEFNILDSKMISNLRTIREISTGASGKVLEVAKEEKYALKVMYTGVGTINPRIVQALKKFFRFLKITNSNCSS